MNNTTAANHILPLSSEEHLYDILGLSEFNIYDYNRGVFHIDSLETGPKQKRLFEYMKECSQSGEDIVTYGLVDSETALFTIFDLMNSTEKEGVDIEGVDIYVYGTTLMREIEYLFGVTISSKLQQLQAINNRSFADNWNHLEENRSAFNFSPNQIDFDDANCQLHAETAEAYEKAITHLKFLDDLSQDCAWHDEGVITRNGKTYKHLYFADDTKLTFTLNRMQHGYLDTDFMFSISFNESLVDNKHNLMAENRALLQRLMPSCRKHRLRGILEAV